MLEAWIIFGIFVMIDAYLIYKISYIKRNGKIIKGNVVNVKSKGDSDGFNVYISTVEYQTSDGIKGKTKAQTFGRRGQEIELYEYKSKVKTKVVYVINYMNYLVFTMTITVILFALLLIDASN